ncbi:Ankyrin-1 [Dactylella cylindrospora]|nr:Ankyrin-1 [Dactylella cylindrospora]
MAIVFSLTFAFACLPYATAIEWDDFTNNLATDLAPLITLFGEQVTKQFLSESLSIWDNIIFSMAPLGILTAVVSAIRVCNNISLRAFIGRAQESPGTAEVELLSCTSETTSELWHEGGIARVFGAPQILEVVKLESREEDYKGVGCTAGIMLFADACSENGAWKAQGTKTNEDPEKHQHHRPNLSLNIGIKRQSEKVTYMATALGLALQTGVLIYAGLTVYRYPTQFLTAGNLAENYAFPMTFSGTILLCFGMFLCAYIIEKSTDEIHYKKGKLASKMYWVQPGGQKIGDQVFASFIGFSGNDWYIKSSRAEGKNKFNGRLLIAVTATMLGFIIQFVGLRAMHASVIMAQLGATLLMAIVRAGLRTQRMGEKTDVVASLKIQKEKNFRNLLEGYELDFLVTQLEQVEMLFVSANREATPEDSREGSRALKARARLARLTSEEEYGLCWEDLRVREIATQLQLAIEGVMEILSARLVSGNPGARERYWSISICYKPSRQAETVTGKFPFRLRKEGLAWKADCPELEATLGMWAWSLLRHGNGRRGGRADRKNIRLIAEASGSGLDEAKTWYQVWIQRRLVLEEEGTIVRDHPVWKINNRVLFGCQASQGTGQSLYVLTQNSTLTMCAQDIFMSFLADLFQNITDIGGETKTRTPFDLQNTFLLQNSQIEEMANRFEDSGLGSREDAYMCIIPLLIRESKLPGIDDVLNAAQDQVNTYKNDSKWEEAEQLLQWICYSSSVPGDNKPYVMLGELCRAAMRHPDQRVQAIGFDGVANMLKRASPRDRHSNMSRVAHQYGWIGLRIATEIGDDEQLDKLKRSGATEDEVHDYTDDSKLYEWAQKDNITVVRYLIGRENCDVNLTGDDGRTSLSWAAQNGNVDIATLLLESDADRNIPDKDGRTPLSYAAENGHDSLVRMLLNGDISSLNVGATDSMKTPLIFAAQNGHEKILSILLKESLIRIETRDKDGDTALLHAAREGHRGAVELLINKGADVNAQGGSHSSALRAAAEKGHDKIVGMLLSNGAEVNTQEDGYDDALHLASAKGHDKIVEMLLSKGADINARGNGYHTPLQRASDGGHYNIVELLLSKGADFRMDDKGESALKEASRAGHDKVVELLISKGADVNERDEYGTALHLASVNGHDKIVEILLREGADADAYGKYGRPLQLASGGGHDKVVEMLLNKGVNIDARGGAPLDNGGRYNRVLKVVLAKGHDGIVQALLGNGADGKTSQRATLIL